MISSGNTVLLKLEKKYFDKYIKDIFEIEINDIIEFLKICPIFTKVSNETLIKLAIRTEMKKFHRGKYILEKRYKSDHLYLIRRGSVKVKKKNFLYFVFYIINMFNILTFCFSFLFLFNFFLISF
jgi:hypothetical protein